MSQPPVQDQDVFARQLENKKKSKSGIGRALAVIVVSVGAALAAWTVFTPKGQEAKQALDLGIQTYRNPDLVFQNAGSDTVNVLMVGEDYNWVIKPVLNPRTGKKAPFPVVDTKSPPRSDSMIIMSLDKNERVVRMLSLPRDARVTYEDLDGDRHKARKFNSVYASGGTDPEKRIHLLEKVIGEELGIRIDRYAVIKPNSFKKLVEMVGGIYVNVDGALMLDRKTGKLIHGRIQYEDKWAGWKVDLMPGPQWLNGEQAHGYVRFRKDREGDPGRIRRQQLVLKAIAKRVIEKNPMEVGTLAKQILTEFRTDMTESELASVGYFAKNMGDSAKIQPLTLYGVYAGNGDIILNKPKNEKLLAAFFGPSFNPEKFLVKSPSTRGDDIGPANNSSPAVQALLRKAGLLDEEALKREASSPMLHAPVIVGSEEEGGRRRGEGNTVPSSGFDEGSPGAAPVEGAPAEAGSEVPIVTEPGDVATEPTAEPTVRPRRRRHAAPATEASPTAEATPAPTRRHRRMRRTPAPGTDAATTDAGTGDGGATGATGATGANGDDSPVPQPEN